MIGFKRFIILILLISTPVNVFCNYNVVYLVLIWSTAPKINLYLILH